MARPKSVNKDSFPRLFPRHGKRGTTWYYLGYDAAGKQKWFNLGRDRIKALEEYAKLENQQPAQEPEKVPENIVSSLIERYKREVYITKSATTQHDNDREFKMLEPVFGKMPIDAIKPLHIRKYLDARSAKTRCFRTCSTLPATGALPTRPTRVLASSATRKLAETFTFLMKTSAPSTARPNTHCKTPWISIYCLVSA